MSVLLVLESGGSVLLLKEGLLAFLKGFRKLRESCPVSHDREKNFFFGRNEGGNDG